MGDREETSAELARRLLRQCEVASLATLAREGGGPYASLALLAVDHDASPILLLSHLAEHTRNIVRDDRVSLLLDATGGLESRLAGARRSRPGDGGAAPSRTLPPPPPRRRRLRRFRRFRVLPDRSDTRPSGRWLRPHRVDRGGGIPATRRQRAVARRRRGRNRRAHERASRRCGGALCPGPGWRRGRGLANDGL